MSCVLRTRCSGPLSSFPRPYRGDYLFQARCGLRVKRGDAAVLLSANGRPALPGRYDRLSLTRDDAWARLLVTEGRPRTHPAVQPARRLGG
jgi:hypothetical protein